MMDSFCKIYLNVDANREFVIDQLVELTGGERSGIRTIENNLLIADVRNNDEYDPSKVVDPLDGFLFYKFLIDVEAKGEFSTKYVELLINIIRYYRENNNSIVPACDFEDLLV